MKARCSICPKYGCRMCRHPAAEEVWVAESDTPVARIPRPEAFR